MYEKLVQREMANKGIRRDQISAVNPILYGAAAGYAVSTRLSITVHRSPLLTFVCPFFFFVALGCHLPHRHDQIPYANRRLLTCHRSEIQVHFGLRSHCLADRRYRSLHSRIGPNLDSVSLILTSFLQITFCQNGLPACSLSCLF